MRRRAIIVLLDFGFDCAMSLAVDESQGASTWAPFLVLSAADCDRESLPRASLSNELPRRYALLDKLVQWLAGEPLREALFAALLALGEIGTRLGEAIVHRGLERRAS